MDEETLTRVLDGHKKWVRAEDGGARADLRDAYLRDAYLRDADLRGAYLRGADLRGAYLRDADLRGAYLRDAYLRDADLRGAYLPSYGIPEQGSITAWKAVSGGIARVFIPAEARRTGSLVGRKCRAEWVVTEAIIGADGESLKEAAGNRGGVVYRVGEATYPDSYDGDPRVECTHGIHFFLTRAEAEQW